jgi:hypothetical protein
MNYLRQEKSLRDHEPSLKGFAAIADRAIARMGAPIGEFLFRQSRVGSE